MKLHHLPGRKKSGYTTFGCVWEKGETSISEFILLNEQGEALPVQSKVLAWWSDKSVKWSAHTADAGKMPETVEVIPCQGAKYPEIGTSSTVLQITETDAAYLVNTGRLQMKVKKAAASETLAEEILVDGNRLAKAIYPVFVMEHRKEQGNIKEVMTQEFRGEITSVELEETGFLQGVFCFKGNHVQKQPSGAMMPFVIRMYVWAGSEEIRFQHTF